MVVIGAAGWYAAHPELVARHVPIAIWMLAILVIVKCIVAVVAFRVALDRGLLEVRSIRGCSPSGR